ncbi:MAG: hypothetical protein ACKO4T_10935 [Planctomycetaceae bacterium]
MIRRPLIAVLGVATAVAVAKGDEPPPRAAPAAVRPLPPVEQGFFERIRLAALGDPQDLSEPLLPDDVAPPGQPPQEFEPPTGRKLPPGAKPGPLQQALFTVTELPRLGTGGLGLTTLETSLTIGMPAPTVDSPLLVTPGFGTTFVDEVAGPADPGLPAQLFESWLQARWMRKVGRRLGVDLAIAPGWYSDFANDTPQALRITGHGFGAWEAGDELRVVAGVIYLDRYDVNILPAGGLLWTPSADQRHELIFPRPRCAWRVAESRRSAQWLYIAGEFGGNQWAVRRDSGVNDVVVYHDYRLIAGWERRPADLGVNWRLEAGWVTGRLVEYYLTDTGDYRPADTFMVRAGVWY